jgi:Outer membrane protein beta-barrel domain
MGISWGDTMKRYAAPLALLVASITSVDAYAADMPLKAPPAMRADVGPGEGPLSLRVPMFYVLGGATWSAPLSSGIQSNNCATVDPSFAIGCPPPLPPRTASEITPTSSWGWTAGVGARFAPALRGSVEYSSEAKHNIHVYMAVAGVVNGDGLSSVSSSQLTGNLFLDFAGLMAPGTFGHFNPYAMVGIGAAFNKMGSTLGFAPPGGTQVSISAGGDQTNLLGTVGAGLQYEFTRNFLVDVGYRYVDAGKFATSKTANQLLLPLPVNCAVDCSGVANLREHRVQLQLVYQFQ